MFKLTQLSKIKHFIPSMLQIDIDKFKQRFLEGQKKLASAIRRRKTMRFIACASYIVTILVVALAFSGTRIEGGRIYSTTGVDFDIKLDNCSLSILNADASASSSIYVDYDVPRATNLASQITRRTEGNTERIYISNSLE